MEANCGTVDHYRVFFQKGFNSGKCKVTSDGGGPITDLDQCNRAAALLGIDPVAESNKAPGYPQGCFLFNDLKLYLNTEKTKFGAVSLARPLCRLANDWMTFCPQWCVNLIEDPTKGTETACVFDKCRACPRCGGSVVGIWARILYALSSYLTSILI